jgi:hypothetical protein
MLGGVHFLKNHHNSTKYGLFDPETGDRGENKSLQAKIKTIVFVCDHGPTKQLLRNSFRWRGPIDPLSFVYTNSRLITGQHWPSISPTVVVKPFVRSPPNFFYCGRSASSLCVTLSISSPCWPDMELGYYLWPGNIVTRVLSLVNLGKCWSLYSWLLESVIHFLIVSAINVIFVE